MGMHPQFGPCLRRVRQLCCDTMTGSMLIQLKFGRLYELNTFIVDHERLACEVSE